MADTFAEKFEQALADRRKREPNYGLRTLARVLAEDDPKDTKTILRRLQKYRPKPGSGGAAEVAPTDPSRWEIEDAMGLDRDALRPDEQAVAARAAIPLRGLESVTLGEFFRHIAGEAVDEVLMQRLGEVQKSNAPAAHLTASTAGASTRER